MIAMIFETEVVSDPRYSHDLLVEGQRIEVEQHRSRDSLAKSAEWDGTFCGLQDSLSQEGPAVILRVWNPEPRPSYESILTLDARIFIVNDAGKTIQKYE